VRNFSWGYGRVCAFSGVILFIRVYLGQFLVLLTGFFYDNGYGDAGSEADGRVKSAVFFMDFWGFFLFPLRSIFVFFYLEIFVFF
jgi:hypothetical protein